MFRGVLQTWQSLFEETAEFASRAGPDGLIDISHSEDRNEGVVTVWYWEGALTSGEPSWRVRFEVFRGTLTSWQALFDEAGRFAGSVGPERLIGISHSEGNNEGVVTVWYWE
jgi:hypothetical protein